MTLQALREKRAKLVADMEAVLQSAEDDGRVDLDDTESELYAQYESDLESVKAAIGRRESLSAESQSLEAAEPPKTHTVSSGRAAPEAKTEFSSLGEFVGAVVRHYKGKGDDARLTWDDNAGISAQDGQRMDEGSSGGFLVPSQWRDTLLSVSPQEAIIEGRSNVIEAGDPPDAEITMPALDQRADADGNHNVYGGVEVNWIGEGDTKPETEAEFREVSLRPHEIAAHIGITDKLMRNAPAMSGFLESQMRGALAAAREDAYLNGNGVARPLGIRNAGATLSIDRVATGEIRYEDLTGMLASSLMRGDGKYWLVTQSGMQQLLQIQDPNGGYVWQPNAREGVAGTLFGFPVFWNERSPQLGNTGDIGLMSTNPYYLIKNGSGPFVAMGYINDDFVQNRTRIKVFHNVDAKPWLTEPFTQEGGYQVSPFVLLDATQAS